MKIVNVYISILQFRRALQILGILTKHSLGELFSHTRFSRRRRRKVQKTVHTTPERTLLCHDSPDTQLHGTRIPVVSG